MAQGKKYGDEIREKAFALLATNLTVQEVSKELNIPYTTVKTWNDKWLKQSENGEEPKVSAESDSPITKQDELNLAKLRNEKKKQFVEDAWRLIGKTRTILERRLDRAIADEEALDQLVDEIMQLDYKELNGEQRKALYAKLSKIKVEDLKALSTVLGTLYDKQALANKEATTIVEGTVEIKKFEDL